MICVFVSLFNQRTRLSLCSPYKQVTIRRPLDRLVKTKCKRRPVRHKYAKIYIGSVFSVFRVMPLDYLKTAQHQTPLAPGRAVYFMTLKRECLLNAPSATIYYLPSEPRRGKRRELLLPTIREETPSHRAQEMIQCNIGKRLARRKSLATEPPRQQITSVRSL